MPGRAFDAQASGVTDDVGPRAGRSTDHRHAWPPGIDYRPDIDGLRAIAVLAVIVFHLHESLLPGGFVGVDVFFVISGFLITRNILREIEHGAFSLLEFYRRRVRRIAPAMLVVVAVTLLFAQLLMLPEDARSASKSAFASVASLANVYFWLFTDKSYFAVSTRELPFLHLWSLGVEEQFYLLWPLALVVLYRPWRVLRFAAGLLAVAIGSFALAQALVADHPEFTYYMLPTRAGELALGALVAIAVRKRARPRWPNPAVAWLAAIGMAMLVGSLILLRGRLLFPGWLAVPPTLGTAMLIYAGHCGTSAVSRVLATRGLVWIGLLSYSAYLWHWPLLALYRYGYGEIRFPQAIALFAATMGLAWLSYRFVELPARRSTATAPRLIAQQYVVPGAGIALVALGTIYPAPVGALSAHADAYRQRLARLREATTPAVSFAWTCQHQWMRPRDTVDPRCVLGAAGSGEPRAILWGDSNAAHYIGMVEAFAKQSGFRFRNLEIPSCPPLRSDPRPFVEPPLQRACTDSLGIVAPVVDRFDVVIMAASWSSYAFVSEDFLPTLLETARGLASAGKLVILIGKAPEIDGYDRRCREKALLYPLLACPDYDVAIPPRISEVNARLRAFAQTTPNVRYFDANDYLCPHGTCPVFEPTGEPRYYDENHLTVAASAKLGAQILAREGVPAAFASIPGWDASEAARSAALR
jgi:peptidoglycan/LPS O-acetylase OafA/YrhL